MAERTTIYLDDAINLLEELETKRLQGDVGLLYAPMIKGLKALPSAQPERLTDDDFETIRIHLNAYKEKLCNQHRWEEADEYQRIIDRFMAFASAQPDSKELSFTQKKLDTISRQAAIDHLKKRLYETALNNNTEHPYYEEIADNRVDIWLNELPSAQPEKHTEERTETHACDLIDRQAAIDVCNNAIDLWHGQLGEGIVIAVKKKIEELPSAQPEIIRCKDCKHWRQQTNYLGAPLSFGFCESDDMWRSLYGETYEVAHIDTDDDFYCGYAERKTNE